LCRGVAAPVTEALEGRCLFNAVTSLQLINAQNDQVIKTLNQGDSINLAEFPAGQLSIRANVDQGVQSVRFGMDNVASVRVENAAPYVLFGDVNGNISGGTFSVGEHRFSATPFSADNATGTIGTPVFISFTVTNQPVVTNLVLVNAQTDQAIQPLNNGDTINLADFPPNQLSIRADVAGGPKSVRFKLDDNANFRTESAVPYVIFGDNPGGDIIGGTFAVGQHEVVATPFTGSNGGGVTGINKSVTFNVVNNAPAAPEVTGLFLIDADTDEVIADLTGNAVLNRRDLPTEHLNIRATTSGPTGSVRFDLDTTQNPHIENFAPYALFGDSGNNDYAAGSISDGLHSLSVTPFTGANATGIGQVNNYFFTIDNAPVVTGLFLINTDTQQVIREIHDGDMINQSDLPTQNLNVNATVNGGTEGVKFGLDGNANFRVENYNPFALFGDASGTFVAGTFNAGSHTITATPFRNGADTGIDGDPLEVDFSIVGGAQS
jgi:hypothetical protein